MDAFKFELQLALDKAQWEKEQCVLHLQEAKTRKNEELTRCRAIEEKIEKNQQQIDSAFDKDHGGPMDADASEAYMDRRRYAILLRDKNAHLRQELKIQQSEASFAEQLIQLRTEELNDVTRRIEALERLRERRRKAFQQERQRKEQNLQDELGLLKFSRENHRE